MSSTSAEELLYIAFIVAFVGGWITNIVKLISMIDHGITTMFILRIVGIFAAPLGAILGYF